MHARKLGIIIGIVFAAVVIFIMISTRALFFSGGEKWARMMTASYRCYLL
jgi:hypothetical protein